MRFFIILGIVFFVGSILLIPSTYEEFKVDRNGIVVKMRIEELPKICIGSRVRYNVTYSYEGVIYQKQTRGDFCQRHIVGEMIHMKYLKGSEIILRPEESSVVSFVSLAVLGLGGLIISISQWKKIAKSKSNKK